MNLKDFPPDYSQIIDMRPGASKKTAEAPVAVKGDLEIPESDIPKTDYENPYDPNAPIEDIGFDQQPVMRGYGKVEKNIKQWRVR